MRRYVNMAKSGRMAATRRVPPGAPRPVAKATRRGGRKRGVPVTGPGGKRD